MKKLLSLVLILCMACMLIPAMADEDISGEWYGSLMGMGVTITLNADTSYAISMSGNVAEEGTWKVEEGKLITVPANGNPETTFEIQEAALYANMDGMELTLTRDPANAPAAVEIAEAKTDATAEEYYGTWACSAIEVDGMTLDAATYTSVAGSSLPQLKISEGKVEFIGEDMISSMLNMFTLAPVYADGAINTTASLTLGDQSMAMTVQLQMLQDGQIKAVLSSNDSPMTLYFAPAAAEEEPAA